MNDRDFLVYLITLITASKTERDPEVALDIIQHRAAAVLSLMQEDNTQLRAVIEEEYQLFAECVEKLFPNAGVH